MRDVAAALAIATIAYFALSKKGQEIMTSAGKTVTDIARSISSRGIQFIKTVEGFFPTPYNDAGGKSVGYGHFILPGENLSSVTQARAEIILRDDIAKAETVISKYVKVPLTQGQHDALVSLVFNIGSGNFSTSTLLKKLNAGDYSGAAAEFPRWNKTKTPSGQLVVSNALDSRRAAEKQIFLS